MPISRYWRSIWPSSEIARMVPTATIQRSATGMRRFHPNAMNWS